VMLQIACPFLCRNSSAALHAVKVAAEVVLVQIALLDLLSHLPFALACFLGVLEFESMLVHGEAHCLDVLVR
jgi:hypothetical protein